MSERFTEFFGDPDDLEPVALLAGFDVQPSGSGEVTRQPVQTTEGDINAILAEQPEPVSYTRPKHGAETTATYGVRTPDAPVEHAQPQSRRSSLAAQIGVVGLSALVLASGAVFTGIKIGEHQDASVVAAQAPVAEVAKCPPVDPASLKTAKQLLANPNSKQFNTAEKTYAANAFSVHDTSEVRWEKTRAIFEAKNKMAQDVADKHKLTIYNSAPYAENLLQDITAHPDKPKLDFVTYFKQAQSFAKLYGLNVQLGGGGPENYDKGMRAATMPEYQTKEAKLGMYNLMETLGTTPVEYIQQLHIQDIVLAYKPDLPNNNHNTAAYNKSTGAQPDKIVINLKYPTSAQTYAHEEWHSEDEEDCTPADLKNDPSYVALNNSEPYAGDGPTHRINYAETEEDLTKLRIELFDSEGQGDTARADQLRQEIIDKQQRVAFSTWYAEQDPGEDKAETGSWITSVGGDYYKQALTSIGPLRDKFIYLVGRLTQRSQRIAHYYADVNDHNITANQ